MILPVQFCFNSVSPQAQENLFDILVFDNNNNNKLFPGCVPARCFSFGIGEGASSALISGVAKQGGGHAQFITGQDRMQPKVMQSLRFALQPAVVDISVKWNVPKGVSVTPLSPPIRVLFQGQRALLYAQVTGEVRSLTSPVMSVNIV
uniref:Uncharacterized protein n=1 Tax=Hucho hucho TaxID=62062 RepID=A0A4W5LMZ3_9TELE